MLPKREIVKLLKKAIKEGIEDRWEKRSKDVYAQVPTCQLCDVMLEMIRKYPTSACQPCPMRSTKNKCSKGWKIWVNALTIQKKEDAAIVVIKELKSINIEKAADVILSALKEAQKLKDEKR